MRISGWSSDVCSSDLAEHGAGALDGGTASARRPARQRGHRPANGGGDMKPLDQEQHKPDMEIAGPRVHFLSYQSAEQWAWAGAVTLAAELRRALEQRSEENTSELKSLMRNSYAVLCLKKKNHDI